MILSCVKMVISIILIFDQGTLCLLHALYKPFKAFLLLFINVGKVSILPIGVGNLLLLLQIAHMPLSPNAYRLFFLIW